MQRNNDYGSEGECIVAVSENRKGSHDCPLREQYESKGLDPFKTQNWHSVLGLIIQTLVLLGSLLGFVRYLEKRLDTLDSHARIATINLLTHLRSDHYEKDRTRLMLHNSCSGAMKIGCHPDANLQPPTLSSDAFKKPEPQP